MAKLCVRHSLSDWRQYDYNIRQVKRLMRIAQNKKRSSVKTEEQKKQRDAKIVEAHQAYIEVAQQYLTKATTTLEMLKNKGLCTVTDLAMSVSIDVFMKHAVRQIDQVKRRVIFGEIIPHDEKVFSLFEPHTEWISKGKAGVPVELGLRVCVLEDRNQFILHHQVMEKQTDDQVAISMVTEAQKRFPHLTTCSFDKGFHSPENQKILSEQLGVVALPRKGRLSREAREKEQSESFIKAHHKHSAVESGINALEVHGLDVCPDHGIYGFKRYVALAVVARNIQRIGAILIQQERQHEEKRKRRLHLHDDDFTRKKAA